MTYVFRVAAHKARSRELNLPTPYLFRTRDVFCLNVSWRNARRWILAGRGTKEEGKTMARIVGYEASAHLDGQNWLGHTCAW